MSKVTVNKIDGFCGASKRSEEYFGEPVEHVSHAPTGELSLEALSLEECRQVCRERQKQRLADEQSARLKIGAASSVLETAGKVITGERQDTYGSPEDSFASIASYWTTYLKADISTLDVAHMMVLFKLARTQGQKPSKDNYVDICGYAAIAGDRLTK